MKQQVVLAHAIRQTETPAVLDSWVTNTNAVEILCPQKFIPTYRVAHEMSYHFIVPLKLYHSIDVANVRMENAIDVTSL